VVDASGASGRDPVTDLRAVCDEVMAYGQALLERPRLIVATKRDAVSTPDPLPALQAEARHMRMPLLPVSAVTGEGLLELKRAILRLLDSVPAQPPVVQEHA
jgi:GTPase